MRRVIFVFLDGIGLGLENKDNPFFTTPTPFLEQLLDGKKLTRTVGDRIYPGAVLLALDAVLGVDGLPQSATGQCSLFTGVNAPKLLGYHLNAYPNEALKEALKEKNMFLQLMEKGLKCTFANAYRPDSLDAVLKGSNNHLPCTTLMNFFAGLPFRTLADMDNGQAVFMDITNSYLIKQGYKAKLVTPEEAGKRLAGIAKDFHLTLYESFITDIVGHSANFDDASMVVMLLDKFLASVAANLDKDKDILLVTSDHGNLEDLGVKGHTKCQVPALIVGSGREELARLINRKKDITGVLPALLDYLSASTQN
ncbi:MAG: hypothetical protein AB1420_15570 [Bacillota bacterium]